MAATIMSSNNPLQMSPTGARNTVEGMVEAKIYAVRFTSDDSVVCNALLLQFGKDADGKANFVVIQDEEAMKRDLKLPTKALLDGARAWLSAQSPVRGEDIPSGPEVL